jgi:hypothetical protein
VHYLCHHWAVLLHQHGPYLRNLPVDLARCRIIVYCGCQCQCENLPHDCWCFAYVFSYTECHLHIKKSGLCTYAVQTHGCMSYSFEAGRCTAFCRQHCLREPTDLLHWSPDSFVPYNRKTAPIREKDMLGNSLSTSTYRLLVRNH